MNKIDEILENLCDQAKQHEKDGDIGETDNMNEHIVWAKKRLFMTITENEKWPKKAERWTYKPPSRFWKLEKWEHRNLDIVEFENALAEILGVKAGGG